MSTYITRVKNPNTGTFEDAVMIDDYFGQHRYGMQFVGEDEVYDVDQLDYELEFEDDVPAGSTFGDFNFFKNNGQNQSN